MDAGGGRRERYRDRDRVDQPVSAGHRSAGVLANGPLQRADPPRGRPPHHWRDQFFGQDHQQGRNRDLIRSERTRPRARCFVNPKNGIFKLASSRDANRYRAEAARFRTRAAAVNDVPTLRDSYLGVAMQYDVLADLLEGKRKPATPPPIPSGAELPLVEEAAAEYVRRQGPAAAEQLRDHQRIAEANGDPLSAATWRDMAQAAERILADARKSQATPSDGSGEAVRYFPRRLRDAYLDSFTFAVLVTAIAVVLVIAVLRGWLR